MLLITAILFVKIAQAIPGPGLGFGGGPSPQTPQLFYEWMGGMLAFDVVVLIIDWIKSGLLETQGWNELRVYAKWIVLNIVLAFACYFAASPSAFISLQISAELIAIGVFAVAFIRSVLDYSFGKNFMFP